MRILLVGDFPPPQGGISVHVAGLASALAGEGWEVRVLDVARPPKRLAPQGVTAAHSRFQVAWAVAAAASRGFLVHVHVSGHNAPSWSLALASTWLSHAFGPSIITVHSGLAPAYLRRWDRRWRARVACSAAARVLCANDDIQRALRRCDVRPGRLEVLPAYLGAEGALALPDAFLALRRSCRRILVVALGEGPEYGQGLLVETLERIAPSFPGLGICAIGRGADAALGRRLAALLGERALVLGEVSHGEALGLFAQADVFLRPTLADGDALSLREALARGAAAVATSVVPRPEGTLVAPPNSPAFADAVLRALDAGRSNGPRTFASAHRRLGQIYRALLTSKPRLAAASP
ncbi:MAG: glycosyltransferase [Myxococcales bacterium]